MYFPNERGKFGIGREHSRSPFGATLDWYDDLSTPYASARQRCVSDPSHTVPVAPLNTYTFLKIWIGPNEQIWGEKFPRAPVRALARTDGVGDYPCDHKIHLPSEQGVGDVGTGPNSRKEQNRHKMRSPKVFIRRGGQLRPTGRAECRSANGKYGSRVKMLGKSVLNTNILRGKYIIRSSCSGKTEIRNIGKMFRIIYYRIYRYPHIARVAGSSWGL